MTMRENIAFEILVVNVRLSEILNPDVIGDFGLQILFESLSLLINANLIPVNPQILFLIQFLHFFRLLFKQLFFSFSLVVDVKMVPQVLHIHLVDFVHWERLVPFK